MMTFKHILVAVDFGPASKHALDVAIDLAKQYGSALTLVHTWEVPVYAYGSIGMAPLDIIGPIQDGARGMLDEAVARAAREVPAAKGMLRRGVPWREVVAAVAETKADLVVTGTHGRHGVERVVLGSVAEKVVRHSPVAVLVAREPAVT